jgi:hypothetical protein
MKYAKSHGTSRLHVKLDRLTAELQAGVADVCHRSAETVRAVVVIDINTQKPNPDFVVPKNATGRRLHVPSPPHGPPNADTGNLSARYTTTLRSYSRTRVAAAIVAGTIYAFWLEFGTFKMLPRPHLIPRFREHVPKFKADLKSLVHRAASAAKKGRNR